jgi:hypothetical protein
MTDFMVYKFTNQSIEERKGSLFCSPYAGITRIRFKEYNLSPCFKAPLLEISLQK